MIHFSEKEGVELCRRRAVGVYTAPRAAPAVPFGPALSRWRSALIADPGALHRIAHGPPLLVTLAAIHGAALRRLEWDRGFLPALRTNRFRLAARGTVRRCAGGMRGLAGLTPLGLVLEALVGVKHLLAGSEDKFRAAFDALQYLVAVLHLLLRWPLGGGPTWQPRGGGEPRFPSRVPVRTLVPSPVSTWPLSVLLAPHFLAHSLAGERGFCPAPFSGLHVVAVLLDFLDDVRLLHSPLKAAQSALERFTILNVNFRQLYPPPIHGQISPGK